MTWILWSMGVKLLSCNWFLWKVILSAAACVSMCHTSATSVCAHFSHILCLCESRLQERYVGVRFSGASRCDCARVGGLATMEPLQALTGHHDGKVANAPCSPVLVHTLKTTHTHTHTQKPCIIRSQLCDNALERHKLSFFVRVPSHSVCECVCGNQHRTLVTGQGL